MSDKLTQEKFDRAVLVGLNAFSMSQEENATEETMEELAALLETAGGETVGVVTQSKDSPDPRTFIGEGKVAEVKELVQAMDANMVVFDNALSPSQQRALTEDLGVAVLDRSALILDIFAQRARTKEGPPPGRTGPVQIFAAAAAGYVEAPGAPGGRHRHRGPGETQLESDRRHIHRKIAQAGGGAEGRAPGALHPAGPPH